MHTSDEPLVLLLSEIAKAADLCLKPWRHSVVDNSNTRMANSNLDNSFEELILRIECRDNDGSRHPEKDMDLEIYKSGMDINITLSWPLLDERPMLWQGTHCIWMDSTSGKRCDQPVYGIKIEALARRIRAYFINE